MAKSLKNKKSKREVKNNPFFIGSAETAVYALLVAVFSLIFSGFLTNVFSAWPWTDPDQIAPASGVSQSPINLGPDGQEKAGQLTVGGLDTDYRVDVTGGDVLVNGGNAVVNHNLNVTDFFKVDADNNRVLINTTATIPGHEAYELQVKDGRTFFNNGTVNVVGGNNQSAFIARAINNSYGLFAYNPSTELGSAITGGVYCNPSGDSNFGFFALAGQRLQDQGVPYAGYLRGKVEILPLAGEQVLYLNSDALVNNLNVDFISDGMANYHQDSFLLKENVAQIYVQLQNTASPYLQTGNINVSGKIKLGSGIEAASSNGNQAAIEAERSGYFGITVYAKGGSTSLASDVSYGLYSLAGSGNGTNYAGYFEGPVNIYESTNSPLVINSQSVVKNLNTEKLGGAVSASFKKYSDLAVAHLDQKFVRRQVTTAGFVQSGSIDVAGISNVQNGVKAPKVVTTGRTGTENALLIHGSNLVDNYALYAQAGSGSGTNWAGYFEGDVKILDHNLYLGKYLEFGNATGVTGNATITSGTNSVTITSSFYNQSKSYIFTTVTNPNSNSAFSLTVTKNAGNFTVNKFPVTAANSDININYFIFNKE